MRLREIRERAEAEGTMKEMFPTAGYTVSIPQYPVALMTPPQETASEPVQEGRLAVLAHEINTRFTLADKLDSQANDHRLAAAIQLAEAKKVCVEHKINFKAWASASVPQVYRTVRDLARVGAAPDPKLALEDLRNKNAALNRDLRERRKATIEANPFAPAGELPAPAAEATLAEMETVAPVAEQPPVVEVKADPAIQASVNAAYEAMTPEAKAEMWKADDDDEAKQRDEAARAEMLAERSQDAITHDLIDSIPTLDVVQRRAVADKAVSGLPAKAARDVIKSMAESLGLKVSRGGSNYFVTVETLLADFATLEPTAQAEFLRQAMVSSTPHGEPSE
jgi:hypothetical protein